MIEAVQSKIERSNTNSSALSSPKNKFLIIIDLFQSHTDLELLGATAVEDALQDKVKDTLESLRYAGIMVWVLTGDKIETALNIAKSCGHISETASSYFITECKEEYQIHQHLDTLNSEIEVGRTFLSFCSLW